VTIPDLLIKSKLKNILHATLKITTQKNKAQKPYLLAHEGFKNLCFISVAPTVSMLCVLIQ